MIKYFCDFCKKEIQLSIAKPEVEVGLTLTRAISANNKTTQKVEHICSECNALLISNLSGMGLGGE